MAIKVCKLKGGTSGAVLYPWHNSAMGILLDRSQWHGLAPKT